jgi:hypothetical protein
VLAFYFARLRDTQSIGQPFEIETRSLNEFEAAILSRLAARRRCGSHGAHGGSGWEEHQATMRAVRPVPSSSVFHPASHNRQRAVRTLVFTSVHESRIGAVARRVQTVTYLRQPDTGLMESDLNGSVTKQLITVATQSSHHRKKDIPSGRGPRGASEVKRIVCWQRF